MKIIISALSAVLLLGCSNQESEQLSVQKSPPIVQEIKQEKKIEKVAPNLKGTSMAIVLEPVATAPKL